MEESLSNEYWKKRCELAEKVIKQNKTVEYSYSWIAWKGFIESHTDTALYMGFIDLLKKNDMWYEFHEPSVSHDQYQLLFGKNGTNFKQTGWVCEYTTVYGCFESGLKALKESLNEYIDENK